MTERLEDLATRLGPARMRAVRQGLTIVGLLALPYIIWANRERSLFGFDAHAYWAVDLSNLYGASMYVSARPPTV